MQLLAVFLIVALAAMVASTRGLPTPTGTDQEGNNTSPASAETHDEFTSVLDRDSQERNLENDIEEEASKFPVVESSKTSASRTKRGTNVVNQTTPTGCKEGYSRDANGVCRKNVGAPRPTNPKPGRR